jgi:hypothetical protein
MALGAVSGLSTEDSRREYAERFIEEVRGGEPEIAANLQIESAGSRRIKEMALCEPLRQVDPPKGNLHQRRHAPPAPFLRVAAAQLRGLLQDRRGTAIARVMSPRPNRTQS